MKRRQRVCSAARRSLTLVSSAVLLLVSLAPPASAAVTEIWERAPGKEVASVAVARDGSVYVVGTRRRSITAAAFLTKYRPDGTRLWTRSWLPFAHASTRGIAVDVAPDGKVAFLGSAQAQCEGAGWFLDVVSPRGALLHHYVTPGWECEIAQSVSDVAATNDLIVVSGMRNGCCADPTRNGWVRGFTGNGRPRWKADFEPPAGTPHGWFDRAAGVAFDSHGNVFASGWAATEFVSSEQISIEGTPVLMKLRHDGSRVFSRRIDVSMNAPDLPVRVAVGAGRVMVTAGVRGLGVDWFFQNGSVGWLGSFTKNGDPLWSRTWDAGEERAAQPGGVAIQRGRETWVVGTRRGVAAHDLRLFIRRYDGAGNLLEATTLDGGVLNLTGTDVAIRRTGERFVTGFVGKQFAGREGRLWRFAG
ncbi:MAG: hypothetical protein ACXWW5_03465 [Actinomycetota bacterium]